MSIPVSLGAHPRQYEAKAATLRRVAKVMQAHAIRGPFQGLALFQRFQKLLVKECTLNHAGILIHASGDMPCGSSGYIANAWEGSLNRPVCPEKCQNNSNPKLQP